MTKRWTIHIECAAIKNREINVMIATVKDVEHFAEEIKDVVRDLVDDRDTPIARVAKLKGMLRHLEWSGGDCGGECPVCGELEDHGHDFDCELDALLGEASHNETDAEIGVSKKNPEARYRRCPTWDHRGNWMGTNKKCLIPEGISIKTFMALWRKSFYMEEGARYIDLDSCELNRDAIRTDVLSGRIMWVRNIGIKRMEELRTWLEATES